MQKYLTNNKGFTLVEVIVVAVIVLILAAVAIPLYNGYIDDSRMSVAENTAASMANAIVAANQLEAEWDVDVDTLIIKSVRGGVPTTIVTPKGYTVSAPKEGVTAGCVTVEYQGTGARPRAVKGTAEWERGKCSQS